LAFLIAMMDLLTVPKKKNVGQTHYHNIACEIVWTNITLATKLL